MAAGSNRPYMKSGTVTLDFTEKRASLCEGHKTDEKHDMVLRLGNLQICQNNIRKNHGYITNSTPLSGNMLMENKYVNMQTANLLVRQLFPT